MEFIDFDTQKDPAASAQFIQWQKVRAEKRKHEAGLLRTFDPQGKLAEALVLDEMTAGGFMLHLETCSHLTSSADASKAGGRKIVHAERPDQWEYLRAATKGAEVVDCASCNPRHELRAAFAVFRQQCIWLRRCFNTSDSLFHKEEPRRVLQKAAPHVFYDLFIVMIHYGLLQAAKVTDPARSWSKAAKAYVESLTVCNLNEHLQAEGLMNQAIEDAAAGVMRYRPFIVEARNKVIAHIDKAAAIADQPIGAHPLEERVAFLDHLQNYNDEVGRAVGEGPLDFRVQAGAGDAIALLQCLRVSLHVKQTDARAWWRVANKEVPE